MTPDTINAVKEALLPVAEKMGQGAEYGWEIIVKGQIAEGIGLLAVAACIALPLIVANTLALKFLKRRNDHDAWVVYLIFGSMINLFGLIIIMVQLYNGLFHLLAPEYKALEFLLSLTK